MNDKNFLNRTTTNYVFYVAMFTFFCISPFKGCFVTVFLTDDTNLHQRVTCLSTTVIADSCTADFQVKADRTRMDKLDLAIHSTLACAR